MKKNILFICPIPPPTHGQSKASLLLLQSLSTNNTVIVINTNKNSLKSGVFSFRRFIQVLSLLLTISRNVRKVDLIYFSISGSILGNLRDLIIYLICYNKLNKVFIHMLGGAGLRDVLLNKYILKNLNKFFISKLGGVIVEGDLNLKLFSRFISSEKVHIVPNFAEDYLFVEDSEISNKYLNINKLQILFLSNLLTGKGHDELCEAYISLSDKIKSKVNLVFVGGFENIASKNIFLTKINKINGIEYLGDFIDGIPKRELFCKSQIFCLPTYYPFEGQPISILEAYSTGCFVISTDHSGIPFIFTHNENGYMVEKKSVKSLCESIIFAVENIDTLVSIAYHNRNLALSNYRSENFQNRIKLILNCV